WHSSISTPNPYPSQPDELRRKRGRPGGALFISAPLSAAARTGMGRTTAPQRNNRPDTRSIPDLLTLIRTRQRFKRLKPHRPTLLVDTLEARLTYRLTLAGECCR